jgi:hypothetical protein
LHFADGISTNEPNGHGHVAVYIREVCFRGGMIPEWHELACTQLSVWRRSAPAAKWFADMMDQVASQKNGPDLGASFQVLACCFNRSRNGAPCA